MSNNAIVEFNEIVENENIHVLDMVGTKCIDTLSKYIEWWKILLWEYEFKDFLKSKEPNQKNMVFTNFLETDCIIKQLLFR